MSTLVLAGVQLDALHAVVIIADSQLQTEALADLWLQISHSR